MKNKKGETNMEQKCCNGQRFTVHRLDENDVMRNRIDGSVKFCPFCGRKLKTETDAEIERIATYLVEESFPLRHVKAIMTIVSAFNWSKESEGEIFAFADRMRRMFETDEV